MVGGCIKIKQRFENLFERKISNSWTSVLILVLTTVALINFQRYSRFKVSTDWEAPASFLGFILTNTGFISIEDLNHASLIISVQLVMLTSVFGWVFFWRFSHIFLSAFTLSYLFLASIFIENIYRASSHTGNTVSFALITLAFVFFSRRQSFTKYKSILSFSNGFETPLWVPTLIKIFLLGSYTVSAMTKIKASGLTWVESQNIQTYIHYFSSNENFLSRLILNNHEFALITGIFILALEFFSVFSLVSTRLTYVFGFLLILFHLIVGLMFGWIWYSHITLLILTCTPIGERLMFKKTS